MSVTSVADAPTDCGARGKAARDGAAAGSAAPPARAFGRLRRLSPLPAALIDAFVPEAMRDEAETQRRARLFIASHLFGPFLGHTVLFCLWRLDPDPGPALWTLIAADSAFWLLPLLLRLTGRFLPLALLSVQNLAFLVLFGSYNYGGVSSPLLPWLLTAPLLAAYYLGDNPRLRLVVLGGLALDIALFYAAFAWSHSFPVRVPTESLAGLGIVSIFCAGIYVSAMALYHARILASRSELQREVESHKATATKLQAAKEMAEMANRTKSEFLATMSHELRTPLNAIIGFAQIMSMETFGPLGNDRYRDYATDIGDSGTHLLEIINDILDIAKMEAGKLEIADEAVDVGAAVAAACRLVRARAEKAGLTLAAAVPAELPPLRADARQLRQMLLNLLTNAVKFTPAGGRVEVRAAIGPEGGFGIVVADTGIGIAPEHLPRVVEPFFQVDSSLSRRHDGTGLGLTLVAAMVREHGGTLRLESELGKGTIATIGFPHQRLLPLAAVTQAASRFADAI